MKSIKCILLISTCLFLSEECQAEINLTFDVSNTSLSNPTLHTHHTPVELKPISVSNSGVKFAAVCALANGGCDDLSFNLDNTAQCKNEDFVTSCPYGYVPDLSQKCPYNDSFFKCKVCSHTCSSGSLSYCSSEQVETGSSKNDCNETCYSCRTKTCEEGGYASSINSCQKASTVSFAGKTCYTNVAGKTCTDGGYVAAIPNNQVGQSTSYCGNTCYYNIRTPSCSEGGFLANIPVNQVCNSTAYYGQTCHKDCYQPACSSGGYLASIPANQNCSSTSYYGRLCYYNCKDNCPYKGTLTSCPNGYVCTLEECSSKFYISGCAVNYTNYCKQPITDCATLGYNQSTCVNGGIRCPYDTTKMACK